MNKTMVFLSRWKGAAVILLLFSLILVACGEPTAAPTQPSEPTEVSAAQATATSAPTETPLPTEPPTDTPAPTDTPVPTDTPAPTDTPTPEPIDDSACITCHTSEETLKALATEEEKPEVESEGEG